MPSQTGVDAADLRQIGYVPRHFPVWSDCGTGYRILRGV
jgi:hypothetical protein